MENVNIVSKSETDIADDKVFVEEEIWEELLQGAIWEFCFDVHRAIKLNYLFLDPALDPNVDLEKKKDLEQSEEAEYDAFDQKMKPKTESYNLLCPNCKKLFNAAAIGKHLLGCLGISGRTSSRDASRKIAASTDEIDDDNNSSSSSGKRKFKKSQGKRQSQKAKARGISSKPQSPSESNDDFQSMTYEEKEAFPSENCGAFTSLNERCVNSCECTQHTDEERHIIHLAHLSSFDDASNGQIDADTTDINDSEYLLT